MILKERFGGLGYTVELDAAPFAFSLEKSIPLDATLGSSLSWKRPLKPGPLLWHLDLGLFDRLPFPLGDVQQQLSCQLAIEHFTETLLQPLGEETLGVVLFKGSLAGPDFEAKVEELRLLASFFPEWVTLFLLFDYEQIESPSLLLQLTSKAHFPHMQLAVKSRLEVARGLQALCWRGEELRVEGGEPLPLGLCLPESAAGWRTLEHFHSAEPYRVFPGELLTEGWEGLERLIVFEEGLSVQTRRKLQGFVASGGTLLSASSCNQLT